MPIFWNYCEKVKLLIYKTQLKWYYINDNNDLRFLFSHFSHQASNNTQIHRSNIYILISGDKPGLHWKQSTDAFEKNKKKKSQILNMKILYSYKIRKKRLFALTVTSWKYFCDNLVNDFESFLQDQEPKYVLDTICSNGCTDFYDPWEKEELINWGS